MSELPRRVPLRSAEFWSFLQWILEDLFTKKNRSVCVWCVVCEGGVTVAGEFHGEKDVVLKVTQEVGAAEESLQDGGQCGPPLLSAIHLQHTPQ